MNRRALLLGLASVCGASTIAWLRRNELIRWIMVNRESDDVKLTSINYELEAACQMSPEQTEGPFKVSSELRGDIREDRKGLPLLLDFQLLTNNTCLPLSNAVVEIWHCDAAGRYSGYPEDLARKPFDTMKLIGLNDPNNTHVAASNTKTYLRGAQLTDVDGRVQFTTIFPGWYDPRVTHVHVAVTVNNERRFTSQIYFPMDFANDVYATHPDYIEYGLCPYTHSTDPVLASYPKADGLLVMPQSYADGIKTGATLVVT